MILVLTGPRHAKTAVAVVASLCLVSATGKKKNVSRTCYRTNIEAADHICCLTKSAYIDIFCLLVGCLTSQQYASVSQGRICTDNFTCCPTEIEIADHTFHLIQSQFIDTGPTSPSTDPITTGTWQGSHWSAKF